MKKISDGKPASTRESPVARYIDRQLEAIRPNKSMAKVADEAGLPQRNLLSMIRAGQTKLPFERLKGLSKALEVNQNYLFRMALAEYQPHVKELFEEAERQTISKFEQELVDLWREATDNRDPPVEPIAHEIGKVGKRALEMVGAVGLIAQNESSEE